MTDPASSVIWVVSGHQGPIQAYRKRADADEFAERFDGGVWVNSLGLIEAESTDDAEETDDA
jgi:hypothetical protein